MDDAPRSSRLFVTRKLPWILALAAMAVFLATLNPWISIHSLRPVVEASGWTFESPFAQPLNNILGGLVSKFTGASFPGQINLLTVFMAGAVVYYLARSVALLPHDRRHEERIRESSDIGLLTISLAWVPPVFAVGLLIFQLTFWQHATSFTGEMLDLLVFAYSVRSLLEYRLDGREARLFKVAFAVGIGIANNYAMIGFAPLFLVSTAWICGLRFLNAGLLAKLFVSFLLGLAVVFLIPALAMGSGRFDDGFWPLMKEAFVFKKTQILLLPRGRFLLLALLMILPLGGFGVRWASPSGIGLDRLATSIFWQLLKLGWFAACISVAFDVKFSPRQLGYGVPLLTFSYCASLAVGYVAGYYLLLAWSQPDSRHGKGPGGLLPLLTRGLGALVVAMTFAVPAGLVFKNWSVIRAENSNALRSYVQTMLAPLHSGPAVIFSDDPVLAMALVAGTRTGGDTNRHLVINTRLAPSGDYRNFLAANYSDRWPALSQIASSKENIAGLWLSLAVNEAQKRHTFLAAPSFSFFAEPFDFRPIATIYGVIPRKTLLPVPANPVELDQIRNFWNEVQPTLDLLAKDIATGSSNAAVVGSFWSRAANTSGVFMQEAGQLKDAARLFDVALLANPANAAASANRVVNEALVAGKPIPPEAVKEWDGKTGLLDTHGPVDEPEFLRIFGYALLAQKDDLVRRAAISFDRATKLSPTNRFNRFGFITAAVTLGDLNSATNALNRLRTEAGSGGWTDVEKAGLAEAEGRVLVGLGNYEAAIAPLLEARRLNPAAQDVHDYLSYLYLLLGKMELAAAATEAWEKSASGAAAPLTRRALIYLQLGDYGPAAETLTRILDASPENSLARVNRAIARLMLNQLAESKADYSKLLKDGNDTFQIRYGLAEIAKRENQPAEELKQLEKYLVLAPSVTAEYTNVTQRVTVLKAGQ